jgi:hypothetical protein
MTALSIRSRIPALQSQVDKRILAAVDLTWEEFMDMVCGVSGFCVRYWISRHF